MNKICLVGDMHWREKLTYSDYVIDARRGEWDAVIDKVVEVSKDCDSIILMGDVFDRKHNPSPVVRRFVEFLKHLGDKDVHIISGNHCVFGDETALDFLQKVDMPNWHVYTPKGGITTAIVNGKSFVFVPYMTNYSLGVESHEDGVTEIMRRIDAIVGDKQFDAVFLHHAISGSKTVAGGLTDLFGEIVLSREELEKRFKLVVGGHIHEPQLVSPRTIVTGSLFTSEIGEKKKSLWTVDLDTQVVNEVPLPVRPIIKIDLSTPDEIKSLGSVSSYSIVKCVVHSKEVEIDAVREELKRFDAYILVEDYPSERQKVRIDDGAMEDLSVENLLKVYAKQNNIEELDLMKAFDIVRK